jgi:transcription-repair coupling factor (superfamily II helicase)
LAPDSKDAIKLKFVADFYGYESFVLPDFRAEIGDDLRSFAEELRELFTTLSSFNASKKHKKILISPYKSLIRPLPAPKYLQGFELNFAQKVNIVELKAKLYAYGYEFVDIVAEAGEVSFRGDIMDIFAPNMAKAVRVCFFDDEIESIREFDLDTQKSDKAELENIYSAPAFLALSSEDFEKLNSLTKYSPFDGFFKDVHSFGLWCFWDNIDYLSFFDSYRAFSPSFLKHQEEDDELCAKLAALPALPEPQEFKEHQIIDIKAALEANKNKKITVISANDALLKQAGIYELRSSFKHIEAPFVINIQSRDELIISLNKSEKKQKSRPKKALALDEFKPGDYIVHDKYGVGIFEGLKHLTVLGSTKDFVEIRYQNDDKLLVPVENLVMIDRFIGEGGAVPVLDKLGKSSFLKLKESVRSRLFEIAGEIVRLAAERELQEGVKLNTKKAEIAIFQKDAGFVYTEDQARTIDEIFADFGRGVAMDRLLSGDVGFGKTEVAMNAVFAAALNGYSAVVLAPTTLLVSQHYKSFNERFAKYGIKCEKVDRFVSAKDKKATLEALKNGALKVAIGTHALLDADAKDLALVVVDEEHKFGVKQKEKLKALSRTAHILSMSATPIPRSLNMALSQVKSLSEINTPPRERLPIKTFVREYDEKSVKEAVLRELRRGGQLFYIHNRIASLEDAKRRLLHMLPNLRIEILHSKIGSDETDKIMFDFEEGKYDILLSTSIIESGINLPKVNTIMIDSADMFGMADLHQLRGRVGRGGVQGYAYFFVESKEELTDEAKKRLIALESNSYLGSGAALAYQDLEIRGGGNIVGEAQSGHIKNIGYGLYLRMLEDAINELSGKSFEKEKEVELKLTVSAFISPEFIMEDRLRLEAYRRLSRVTEVSEIFEIEEELNDRFGKPDLPTRQFLQLIEIKVLALKTRVSAISNYAQNITVNFEDGKKEYLTSPSKDDDDILLSVLKFLRAKK